MDPKLALDVVANGCVIKRQADLLAASDAEFAGYKKSLSIDTLLRHAEDEWDQYLRSQQELFHTIEQRIHHAFSYDTAVEVDSLGLSSALLLRHACPPPHSVTHFDSEPRTNLFRDSPPDATIDLKSETGIQTLYTRQSLTQLARYAAIRLGPDSDLLKDSTYPRDIEYRYCEAMEKKKCKAARLKEALEVSIPMFSHQKQPQHQHQHHVYERPDEQERQRQAYKRRKLGSSTNAPSTRQLRTALTFPHPRTNPESNGATFHIPESKSLRNSTIGPAFSERIKLYAERHGLGLGTSTVTGLELGMDCRTIEEGLCHVCFGEEQNNQHLLVCSVPQIDLALR
jgi:hypothetical protein